MKIGTSRAPALPYYLAAIALAGGAAALLLWGLPSATPPAAPPPPGPADDVGGLVAAADRVVVARVVAITPRWSGGRIVSDVDVDVERTLKGASANALTITHGGGSIDGIGMRVVGNAHFSVGERALLLLRSADGSERVLGRALGKLDVVDDADGKPLVLWPSATGRSPRALDDVARSVAP